MFIKYIFNVFSTTFIPKKHFSVAARMEAKTSNFKLMFFDGHKANRELKVSGIKKNYILFNEVFFELFLIFILG